MSNCCWFALVSFPFLHGPFHFHLVPQFKHIGFLTVWHKVTGLKHSFFLFVHFGITFVVEMHKDCKSYCWLKRKILVYVGTLCPYFSTVFQTASNHKMAVARLHRFFIFLQTTLCLLGIFLSPVEPFSPPVCPCRLKDIRFTCSTLTSKTCEIVYDFCGCCPKCALDLNEKCQAFGTPCKKGLVCLWDRFWYEEPISGKCVYGKYFRKPPNQFGNIYWNTLTRRKS